MNKKLPKYNKGGKFFKDAGDFLTNTGTLYMDTVLSGVGANNVIDEHDYKGNSGHDFAKASVVTGGVSKAIVPVAAGVAGAMIGGPQGAQMGYAAGKGVQSIGGAVNPQGVNDPEYAKQTQQMNQMNQGVDMLAGSGMQVYGMASGMPKFPMGGMNMSPNAEVEKQENSIAPNGEFTQYNGPTHENGGIPTKLSPGEMVFSDRLKMGKKTFAQLNKPNNTNKEDKILSDNKANSTAKLTAELMKQAKLKASMDLFNKQEALKQSKMENYAKRLGITGENKFPGGGTMTPEQYKQAQSDSLTLYNAGLNSKTAPSWQYPGANEAAHRLAALNGQEPQTTKGVFYENQPGYTGGYNVGFTKPTMATYDEFLKNAKAGSTPTNVKVDMGKRFILTNPGANEDGVFINSNDPNTKYKYQGGSYVKMSDGGVYESLQTIQTQLPQSTEPEIISQGIQGNPYDMTRGLVANTPNTTPEGMNWGKMATQIGLGLAQNAGNMYDLKNAKNVEVETYGRVNPNLMDSSADIAYNNSVFRKAEGDVRNASVGNSSTYLNNRKDLAINQMLTNSRIRQQYENQNAGIKNQMGMYNNNVGIQETIANAQNRARSQDLQSNAYRSMGKNAVGQYKDVQMGNRDEQIMKLIAARYPDAMNDPAFKGLFGK